MTVHPNSPTSVAGTPSVDPRPASRNTRNTARSVTIQQLAAAWRVMEARSTMPRRVAGPSEVERSTS